MLVNKSFHGHATKLQPHLFHSRGTNNSPEVQVQEGNMVLTFHCGIIHSVWSSQSQINHHVTAAIKETVGV